MTAITARQCWQLADSEARYRPKDRPRDEFARRGLFKFFGSTFPPAFPRTFATSPVSASAGGWWVVPGRTCVGAYAAKDAVSYAASKINLANPGTVDLTDNSSYPTWDAANGWASDSTQTLVCNVSAGIGWTHIVRFSNCTSGNFYAIVSGSDGWKSVQLVPRAGLNLHGYIHGSNSGYDGAGYISSGVMAIAGNSAYLDGALEGSMTQYASTFNPIYICGAPAYTSHYAVYSDTLSDSEIGDLYTAIAAL